MAGEERQVLFEYSSMNAEEALSRAGSNRAGLLSSEAASRLARYGPNDPKASERMPIALQFLSKFLNPIIIGLLLIGILTFFYSEKIGAMFIFIMILVSVTIDFFQEFRSGKEIEKLISMVHITTMTSRGGIKLELDNKLIVPGDIIILSAGDIIPADARIIEAKDFFLNEAGLTGESMPVEKDSAERAPGDSSLSNIVFMGTSVVSGDATAVIIRTGKSTEFGSIVKHVQSSVKTSFDNGIRDFTWLMIKAIVVLVCAIFAVNAIIKHDILEALLFSLAVAIGLIPDMLPLVVTVNLAKGARDMAKKHVIIKHLDAIQNIGAMDILCTDKTGTLTEDKIILEYHTDPSGKNSEEVFYFAYLNSYFQTGLRNVLDRAILEYKKNITVTEKKVDEIPFDFNRKSMSVVISGKISKTSKGSISRRDTHNTIITKGAPESLIKKCSSYRLDGKIHKVDKKGQARIEATYNDLSSKGFRVLGIASRSIKKKVSYNYNDEKDLVFLGFIAFLDPPKKDSKMTIEELKELGVEIKILTGDNELVTRKICSDLQIPVKGYANGDDIDKLDDIQLREFVEKNSVFSRLSPLQKERIVLTLKQNKHTVGFMGDGINDAPTISKADVGITVNNGTDIAKESAGIVLMDKSLHVLKEAIIDGRKIFDNIIKYIKMGSSSNFGNMLSVSGASLFLPFLPMLPIQIILNNFLYDMSQLAIPTDNVDSQVIQKPRQWNIEYIKRFMIYIGTVSSVFDFLTFGVFFLIFRSAPATFQTAWFIESLLTQILVVHIIRTERIPFIESRPSAALLITTILFAIGGLTITILPLGEAFGFVKLPVQYILILTGITILYFVVIFALKRSLIKRIDAQ